MVGRVLAGNCAQFITSYHRKERLPRGLCRGAGELRFERLAALGGHRGHLFLFPTFITIFGDRTFPGAYSVRRTPFSWRCLSKPLATRAPQIHGCDFLPKVGRPPAMELLLACHKFVPLHPDRSCGAARPQIRRAGAGIFHRRTGLLRGSAPRAVKGIPNFRCAASWEIPLP